MDTIIEVKETEDTGLNNNIKNEILENWKKHIKTLKSKLIKTPLTKEQEQQLIYCIRFSFLSHPELINLTTDNILGEYKDLILQGLSIRLKTYENTSENLCLINIQPRKYLKEKSEINNNNQFEKNYQNNRYNNNNNNSEYFSNQNFPQNQNIPFLRNQNLNYFNNNLKTDTEITHSNFENPNIKTNKETLNIDEIISNKKKQNIYKSTQNPIPPQDPKISFDYYKNMTLINKNHPIFKYEYDFDENGVFFYLGTLGRKTYCRNPNDIGQVKVFSSSLGKGNLSDFVGRNLVNLRTQNEENSFFGVDLGQERFLIPTSYSIKNRNASSHVMLSWNLEASNDKINFEILDTRIFTYDNNINMQKNLEKERNMLKQPGCTSTWGISKKIREKFPNGFRYFLIKMIDKNSSGGYNLAISGFELYGEGIGRNWNFS